MMQRNYAKSVAVVTRRIATKITALPLIHWANQREGNKMNNLKIVIS